MNATQTQVIDAIVTRIRTELAGKGVGHDVLDAAIDAAIEAAEAETIAAKSFEYKGFSVVPNFTQGGYGLVKSGVLLTWVNNSKSARKWIDAVTA